MKKNFLPVCLLLFLALGIFSCRQGTKETAKEYPMFWTWLDYRPGMNFDSICQVMNDIGMEGIMLNAPTPDDYRTAIPIAHKHGIEVYAWLWTMNLEHDRDKILKEHPEWFSVNRNGKSLAASPFPTPKMSSRMVRQDWGKWNLDIVFPMVYDNFYTNDPSFISDCTIENARDKNEMTTLYCGMMASDGPKLFANMDAALNNGAQGIALFTIHGLRSPDGM